MPELPQGFSKMSYLLERIKQFADGAKILTDWLGSGAQTVDHATAQRRANTCIACPMNVDESFTSEKIADAVKKQVEIKNHLQLRVDDEKSLHICKACGCVNRLKIHVPLERIKPEDDEMKNFHENCWLRSEGQNK